MRTPELSVEPEEPILWERCRHCGGDIYADELYGDTGSGFLCADCLEAEWECLTQREKFVALGCQPMLRGIEV